MFGYKLLLLSVADPVHKLSLIFINSTLTCIKIESKIILSEQSTKFCLSLSHYYHKMIEIFPRQCKINS